jgi:hypothetical protein
MIICSTNLANNRFILIIHAFVLLCGIPNQLLQGSLQIYSVLGGKENDWADLILILYAAS